MRLEIALVVVGIFFQISTEKVIKATGPPKKSSSLQMAKIDNVAKSNSNAAAIKVGGIGNANAVSVSKAGNANKIIQKS